MNQLNQQNNLPRGTPTGAQRISPASVHKFNMDFNEPYYTNNKEGMEVFRLRRVCGPRCLVCPMLNIDSTVITSNVNGRRYPMLTNQNLS